jgi:catechol 2,3-dioxygenase-like lactoylglutathione lyase family enzyme
VIDHIGLAVADMKRARAFYLNALKPLGIVIIKEVSAEETGGEAPAHFGAGGKPFFSIGTGTKPKGGAHVAFAARTRAEVDNFYKAALSASGRDNGPPGPRLTITRPTTAPSSSTPTGTTSRRSATQPHETPVLRLWADLKCGTTDF